LDGYFQAAAVEKRMVARKFEPERRPILSIEQQWKLVDAFRDGLILSADALPPEKEAKRVGDVDQAEVGVPSQALANLEHTWRSIDRARYLPLFADRTSKSKIARTPLEAMGVYAVYGLYPPPELMLAVRNASMSYMDAKGSVTLEESFFGRPKRKAGNYSARSASSGIEFEWAMRIMFESKDAGGDLKAAEQIVEEDQLSIDPESLLRRARTRWTRVSKPE
jgi:hypothetical protein